MVSGNYFYLMIIIICLCIVIWFKVFLFNKNSWQAIIFFPVWVVVVAAADDDDNNTSTLLENWKTMEQEGDDYPIYQPLRSGRIWHKVNF